MFTSAVERHAPGVAQTVCVNFRATFLSIGEWVVLGNAGKALRIHVEAQHLSKKRIQLLAVALGRMSASARDFADIISGAAVTHGPIEITIGTESDASA